MSTRQYLLSKEPSAPIYSERAKLLYVSHTQYSKEWNSSQHTHSCAELFFIIGGSGAFEVQKSQFPVALNDLVVVNSGVPHRETSQTHNPMEYIVLGVEGLEAFADISGYALIHLHADQASIGNCLRLMLLEMRAGQTGCESICQHLLEIILLQLLRRDDFALSSAPSGPKASRECNLVRRYLDNHFKESITLDQLASMVHINKYYLSHAFQKEYNTSPINYLIQRRIEESRFLLSETDHSLSHIAQVLGFSSLSYFSQSFRKAEGISPLEYRKRCRQNAENGPH